jgi:hypothetical protein
VTDDDHVLSAEVYTALAARRLQWDGLLWQVPSLSMTAQAFLMTITLAPGEARASRIIAPVLSSMAAFAGASRFMVG